ncbi:hypothetical protein G7Y89_g12669 [Cudoniella acicularis]|uniref:Uncharacterized protein n=1 Tax=Cudoniella acicularis TaxID=354080 RepID=A0A8H4VWR7_9HELO|nr:hypothetical protein G7Y89_g12669 [Cudoniella acicularis]
MRLIVRRGRVVSNTISRCDFPMRWGRTKDNAVIHLELRDNIIDGWFNNKTNIKISGFVLEDWVINAEYQDNKLPFASEPPRQHDLLPLQPSDGEDAPQVAADLLLPQQVKVENMKLQTRDFSKFTPFATTIQAVYLSSLVTEHVLNESRDSASRKADAAKLDAALQHFVSHFPPQPPPQNSSRIRHKISITQSIFEFSKPFRISAPLSLPIFQALVTKLPFPRQMQIPR